MQDAATQRSEPQDAPLGKRPYRGLGYYTEADAKWFFGRTTERKLIIAHLRTARLTLLYAESGVGKSSVLRAGVTARLREAATERIEEGESPEFIPVVFKQWKDDPVNYLIAEIERQGRSWANELVKAGHCLQPSPSQDRETLGNELAAKINAAAELLGTTFLIILDQFEELFGYPAHQERLADELAGCINSADVRANFLIALREDAYGRIGELFEGRIRSVYGNYLHLEYLTRDAAREAIEKPLSMYNASRKPANRIKLEPELTDAVLGAAGAGNLSLSFGGEERAGINASTPSDGGIEAPFLQLVMERVWDWEIEHGSRVLRKQTLMKDLRGPAEIVGSHLDRALGHLSSEELEAATDIFSDLVAPSGAKIAYTATDLAARHEQHSIDAVAAVLGMLDAQRIVRETDPAPGRTEKRYEIYHDTLAQPILAWARKRKDARLEREKSEAEKEAEAQREQARRFRRRTYFAATTAAICLVALIAVALLLYAKEQQQAALKQATIARVLALGVDAQQNVSSRPDVALSFALAAYRLQPRNAASSMIAALEGFRRTGALAILHGHSDTVNAVSFSPGGRTLATGSGDGTIRLWAVESGRQIGRPLVARGTTGVVSVGFSPDGELLASAGGFDRTVRLWSVRTHSQIGQPLPVDSYAYSVAFSPDGHTLASADDKGIALWDVLTRRESARFTCHCQADTSVAFSPDGSTLATAGYDGAVRFWNVYTHRQLGRINGRAGRIYAIAFSPEGRTLAYAGTNGTISVLDVNGHGKPSPRLTGHTAPVTNLAFSASGELASASADSTVRLWSIRTRRELGMPLTGHAGTVLGVAFSPGGDTVASVGADGTIRLWGARAQNRLAEPLTGQVGAAYSVAVSRDGRTFASGSSDGDVTLWRAYSHAELGRPLVGHGGPIRSVAFSPNGLILAAGAKDRNVRLWSVTSGARLATLSGNKTSVNAVDFSADGRTLASGDARGNVTLWDLQSDTVIANIATGQATLKSVAFSPDGKVLVTAGDETIRVWSPRSGARLAILRVSNRPVNAVAFSPDGRMLASAGDDKNVRLWNVLSGAELGTLSGSTGAIYGVAFSPDGHTLASGGSDNSVRMWDTQTLTELGPPLPDHHNTVYGVAFTPDGRTLVSGGGDATVRVWGDIFWRGLPDLEHQICRLIGTGLGKAEWTRYAHGIPFQKSC